VRTSLEVPALPVVTQRDLNPRRALARIAVVFVLLDVALFATFAGLRVRQAAFIDTSDFHFKGDVRNGFRWGMAAQEEGLLNLYDRIQLELDAGGPRRTLDYTPLRLTAVWLWTRWANQHYPGVTAWVDDYDFTRPMLDANTIAEAASAVLVFALIWLWTRRMDDARRPLGQPRRFLRGAIAGMCGALLFWFNPAVIWVSHCWPQWDVWLMPFFLAAVLLASLDWWFAAGLSLAIGANLKGQILLVAPLMILWPLISLRFGAVLRLLAGFLFAGTLIALPWFKIYAPAQGDKPAVWNDSAVIWCVQVGIVATAAALVGVRMLRRYKKPVAWVTPLYAAVLAAIVLATIPMFGADTAWYTIGFKYGTEKFGDMMAGNGVWNIAKMQQTYALGGVTFNDPADPLTLPIIHKVVTYRTASVMVYGVCLLICAIGAAMHSRRRRPHTRFLVAIAAPWVCFFVVLTQMHGRYLMWGAGMCALLAGESVGLALLGVLVSIISTLGTLQNQLDFAPRFAPDLLRDLQAVDPHLGWMTLLIAMILLYASVHPERRRYSDGVEGSGRQ
jgi:hypothetical protein